MGGSDRALISETPIATLSVIGSIWTPPSICSYYVLMHQDPPSPAGDGRDFRTLRLYDLAPYEAILVRCACGRMTEYGPGLLQRQHRIPSDTLIYDLQYRLRCRHCNRREEFDIGILDTRPRGDGRRPLVERPVVTRPR